jgi:hypothetical protein
VKAHISEQHATAKATGKLKKGWGVAHDGVVQAGIEAGLSEKEVEQAIDTLLEGGDLFEPTLGKLSLP